MIALSSRGAGGWPGSLVEPRAAAVVLLVASAAALGFALGAQYLGGLAPCPLCVYQRWPYAAVILLAGAALIAPSPWPRALVAACAVALAGNALLAGYHVGVEQGWFALPEGCQAVGEATTVDELRAMLAAAPPRCDQVAWSFLGLSMAGWNGLLALALALFAAAARRGEGGAVVGAGRP